MRRYADDLQITQPPVDYALQNTSAWVNMIKERDVPPDGWGPEEQALLAKSDGGQ